MSDWCYWRNRLERALTSPQLAIYDAYMERLARTPAIPTAEEQLVLDLVAADRLTAAQEIEAERLVRAAGLEK